MPDTFVKIASVTVGSGGSTAIEFTSIPQTYTDLCVKLSTRQSTAAIYGILDLYINSTTTNESYKAIFGDGSATSSNGDSVRIYVGPATGASSTSNTFASSDVYLPNYTSTTKYKSVSIDTVGENNATTAYANLTAGLKSENTAITSLKFQADFVQYSTAVLYGIKNS